MAGHHGYPGGAETLRLRCESVRTPTRSGNELARPNEGTQEQEVVDLVERPAPIGAGDSVEMSDEVTRLRTRPAHAHQAAGNHGRFQCPSGGAAGWTVEMDQEPGAGP
jgi:hypothetical protein